MPGLEGVETVRKICDTDPGARVIMISSVSYKEKVADAMAAGAKCFIPKPVTTDQLRKAIEDVLSPRNSRSGAIMRLDFVRMFVDSTISLFKELVGPTVDVPSLTMKPSPVAGREVMAIIGLAGDAQGRSYF